MKRKSVLFLLLMAMFMPLAMQAQGFMKAPDVSLQAVPSRGLAMQQPAQTREDGWLQYDNGNYDGGIGNNAAMEWTWGVMFPSNMLGDNNTLTKVAMHESPSHNTGDFTINIYSGGVSAPSTLLYTETVTPTGSEGMHEVTLAQAITFDPAQNLWITLTETGTYVMHYSQMSNPDPNGQWVRYNGTWYNISAFGSSFANDVWMIRGYVEYVGAGITCHRPTALSADHINKTTVDLSWNSDASAWQICVNNDEANAVDVTENPYTLTGLSPETDYTVKVRANCGSDGYSEWTSNISFTTLEACPDITNLTASNVTSNSATINWTGDNDSYDLRYGVIPNAKDPIVGDNGWYYYDNGDYGTSIGLSEGSSFSWGVMFPAGTYLGDVLFKVSAYDVKAMTGNVTIFNDGDTAPTDSIGSVDVTFTGAEEFVEFDFNQLSIDPTKNLWVVFYNESGTDYPAAASEDVTDDSNGRWVEINGVWYDVADAGVPGYSWMIRAQVGYDTSGITWTLVPGINNPYELTGLAPSTTYAVQVRANCGDGTYTDWTTMYFTTLSSCSTPFDLEATDVTATTATLNWTGAQESYNVRYREAAKEDIVIFADFENGLPDGWTTIDNDGDGFDWMPSVELGNFNCHSGSGCMVSASYDDASQEALTPDNWLITPQIDFRGTMRVWLRGQDADFVEEHFAIYLSTSGNSVNDFTITLRGETVATEEYVEFTANLNRYVGQSGYIAIRHFNCTDMYYLNVDDFGIYGDMIPAGNWVEVNGVTSPLPIDPLAPETEYEWQVQGINPSCEGGFTAWSALDSFTTPSLCVTPTDLESSDITHNSATLDWTGDQDSYNVRYRTTSYNELLMFDSFENGISSWIQSDGSIYSGIPYDGTYMYLFWGDTEPHYLITTELNGLDEGGYVLFYHSYYQGDMSFKVGYSSTTADIRSFEWSNEITSGSSYALYLEGVPEGTKYIAIQSLGTNSEYGLLIDYFCVFGPTVPAGEWVEVNGVSNPLTIEPLIPDTEYEWQVQGITPNCAGGFTEWTESENFITGSGLIFMTDGNWNNGANWYLGEVPADYSDVIVNANAIIPADYDAKVNSVIFGEGGSITIKDGGQLHSNTTVQATVEKEIVGYGEGDANYYLIANPLNSSVNPENAYVGLTNGDYDLYGFNANEEENEWRNYKVDSFTLDAGYGYLYANGENVTLQFTGTLRKQYTNLFYNGNALNYDENNTNLNWNLVGNMFGHNGYVYVGGVEDGYVVFAENQYFYKMNEAGTDIIASNEVVKPCEGVFVQATDTAQYAFISAVEHNVNAKGLDMRLVQDDNIIDVVLIRFGEGRGLEKFQLNSNHTKVFMTEGDKDYSVLFAKEKGMMPVSFKAEKEGNYTLSFIPQEVTYSYLHLIDTLTGTEVDLLVNPKYTFETNAGDFASRFTIVYEVK